MSRILFVLTFLFIAVPIYAFAGFDSAVSSQGISLDVGVPGYPDSLYVSCDPSSSDCSILIATTSPYTILSYGIFGQFDGVPTSALVCDSVSLPSQQYESAVANNYGGFASFVMDSQYHCSSNLTINDDDANYYFVQYVPYDTRVQSFSNTETNISYLVGIGLIILSILLLDLLRRVFSKHSN